MVNKNKRAKAKTAKLKNQDKGSNELSDLEEASVSSTASISRAPSTYETEPGSSSSQVTLTEPQVPIPTSTSAKTPSISSSASLPQFNAAPVEKGRIRASVSSPLARPPVTIPEEDSTGTISSLDKDMPKPGTNVRVVKHFDAEEFGELNLSVDDLLVIEPLDDSETPKPGYWKAVNRHLGPNNGQVGFFPCSVVVVDDVPVVAPPPSMEYPTNSSVLPSVLESPLDTAPVTRTPSEYFDQPTQEVSNVEENNPNLEVTVPPGTQVQVKLDYEATKADEIDLHVNEIVVVTVSAPGGWWKGALLTEKGLGKCGWFPATFVEVIPFSPVPHLPETPPEPIIKHSMSTNSMYASDTSRSPSRFWKRQRSPSAASDTERFEEEPMEMDSIASLPSVSASLSANPHHSFLESSEGKKRFSLLSGKRLSILSGTQSKLSLLQPGVETRDISDFYPKLSRGNISKQSWKEYVPVDVLQNLSKDEVKRQEVIWELFVTEFIYVTDLKMVQEVFLRPLLDRKIVNQKQHESIFANLDKLIPVNEEFLQILDGLYSKNPLVDEIGSLILKITDKLIIYSTYCGNHSKIVQKLPSIMQSNKQLRQFLEESSRLAVTRNMDLSSYLIKPVQRICKYPLLLKEILKCTSQNHSDRVKLDQAYTKLQSVLTIVNEGEDGVQKLLELQSHFADKINLVSPSRYMLRDENVTLLLPPPDSRQKPRRLMLFNDIVILAKKDWRDKYYVVENMQVEYVRFRNVLEQDTTRHLIEVKFLPSGSIYTSDRERNYVLMVSSLESKESWMSAWRTARAGAISSESLKDESSPDDTLLKPPKLDTKASQKNFAVSTTTLQRNEKLASSLNPRPRSLSVESPATKQLPVKESLGEATLHGLTKSSSLINLSMEKDQEETSSSHHFDENPMEAELSRDDVIREKHAKEVEFEKREKHIKEVELLRSTVDKYRAELEETQRALKVANQELENKNDIIQKQNDIIALLKEQKEEARKQVLDSTLSKSIRSKPGDLNTSRNLAFQQSISTNIPKVSTEKTSPDSGYPADSPAIVEDSRDIDLLEMQLQEAQMREKEVSEENVDLKQKLDLAQRQLDTTVKAFDDLKSTSVDVQELNQAKNECSQLKRQLEDQFNKLNALQDVRKEYDSVKKRLDELVSENASLQVKITFLQNTLQQVQTDRAQATEAFDKIVLDLKENKRQLEFQLKEEQETNAHLTNRLSNELNLIKNAKNELDGFYKMAKQEIASKNNEISRLKLELEDSQRAKIFESSDVRKNLEDKFYDEKTLLVSKYQNEQKRLEDDLRQNAKELQNRKLLVEKHAKTIEDMSRHLQQYLGEISNLRHEKDMVEKENQVLQQRNVDLEVSIKDKDHQISTIDNLLKRNGSEMQVAYQQTVDTLRKDCETARNKLAAVEKMLEVKQADFNVTKEQLTTQNRLLTEQIRDLEEQLNQSKNTIADLSKNEEAITQLKIKLQSVISEKDKFSKLLNEEQAKNKKFLKKIETSEKELFAADQLRESLLEMEQKQVVYEAQIQELNSDLVSAENKIKQLTSDLAKKNETLAIKEKEILARSKTLREEYKNILESKTDEIQRLSFELQQIQEGSHEQLRELQGRLASYESSAKDVEKIVQKLKSVSTENLSASDTNLSRHFEDLVRQASRAVERHMKNVRHETQESEQELRIMRSFARRVLNVLNVEVNLETPKISSVLLDKASLILDKSLDTLSKEKERAHTLEAEYKRLEKELYHVQQEYAATKSSLEKQIEFLSSSDESNNKQIVFEYEQKLRDQTLQHESYIARVEQDASTYKIELERLRNDHDRLYSAYQNISSQLDFVRESYDKTMKQLTKTSIEKSKLEVLVTEQKRRLCESEVVKNRLEDAFMTVQVKHNDAKMEKESQLSRIALQITSSHNEKFMQESRIAQLNGRIDMLNKENEALLEQISRVRQEKDALKKLMNSRSQFIPSSEYIALQQRLQSKEIDLQSLMDEKGRIERENNALRSDLVLLRKELDLKFIHETTRESEILGFQRCIEEYRLRMKELEQWYNESYEHREHDIEALRNELNRVSQNNRLLSLQLKTATEASESNDFLDKTFSSMLSKSMEEVDLEM